MVDQAEDVKKSNSIKDYDRALRLMEYHAQVVWRVFGAFLLAEAVILGFLGTGFVDWYGSEGQSFSPGLFGGSIFGLLLVFPWWTTFSYTHTMYRLRIEQARRHEKNDGVAGKLLTQGKSLAEEGSVCVDSVSIVLGGLARKLPPRTAYRFMMLLFALAFLLMAVGSRPI